MGHFMADLFLKKKSLIGRLKKKATFIKSFQGGFQTKLTDALQ